MGLTHVGVVTMWNAEAAPTHHMDDKWRLRVKKLSDVLYGHSDTMRVRSWGGKRAVVPDLWWRKERGLAPV